MKKTGFTISELLITLGIVGVIAAITMPMLNALLPDQDKMKVIKAYNTITKITQELIEDPQMYPGNVEYSGSCNRNLEGLMCDCPPYGANMLLADKYSGITYRDTQFTGSKKFVNLLALKLDVTTNPNASNLFYGKNFTTTDGITWSQTWKNGSLITIDVDDSTKSVNCSYHKTKCKKPDQFKFYVNEYGQVFANDPLTKAYLENPNNFRDKAKDYATAKDDNTKWVS